jgi:hypothetical protein
VGGLALCAWRARRASKNWGTTRAEQLGPHVGDDLVETPAETTTYGVTVDAPAEEVWRWLIQIGQGRGGMYSYEALENLFGLEIHNAESIRPEWQHLGVDDQVRVVPPGKLGMRNGYAFRVAVVNQPSALVLRQHPPEHPWDATWAFLIIPVGSATCRLLARSRAARLPGLAGLASRTAAAAMAPVIFVMTRRMLLGIKERAELSYRGRREIERPRRLAAIRRLDA